MIIACAMGAALLMTGCKSSESAYRKAYEKAQANEVVTTTEPQTVVPVVTPVVTTPVVQPVENTDNVNVRQESVTALNGSLKAYSVVVGSFGVKANAEGLMNRLRSEGYGAVLVQSGQYYRVAATTFDNKADAARSRDQLNAQYPGAWLLYAK